MGGVVFCGSSAQKVHWEVLLLRHKSWESRDRMAKGKLDFLSKDEIERIHSTSLKVLAEVGVLVHSDRVSRMLIDAGASQSKDGKRILMRESGVERSLSSASRSIILAGRKGARA